MLSHFYPHCFFFCQKPFVSKTLNIVLLNTASQAWNHESTNCPSIENVHVNIFLSFHIFAVTYHQFLPSLLRRCTLETSRRLWKVTWMNSLNLFVLSSVHLKWRTLLQRPTQKNQRRRRVSQSSQLWFCSWGDKANLKSSCTQ